MICTASVCVLSPLVLQASDESTTATAAETTTSAPQELSFEDLAKQARPSIVLVRCQDRTGVEYGQGAGFVVDANGLIATARHTIGDGRDITVEFPDGTTKPVVAVHASTHQADICVIQVSAESLPALAISSDIETAQGREVAALGHPRGDRNVMVTGRVSGHQDIDGVRAVRLAMPIQPGNSGGPVLDRSGQVVGIVTLKSAIEDNVGYAVPSSILRELLSNPNPIPIERWRTIGALDPRQWSTVFGANWRQRASRITVDGISQAFGGRTLCLSEQALPSIPYDLAVHVKLDDERGAAGLVFHSDGANRHYGFYTSAGNIRLTRFNGPDVNSWTVLHDEPSPAYRPNDWNVLFVRFHEDRFECFVNGTKVVESRDQNLPIGKAGLASFRGTKAEFRRFAFGTNLLPEAVSPEAMAALKRATLLVDPDKPAPLSTIAELLNHDTHVSDFFEAEAKSLENRAKQLRTLAADVAAEKARRALAAELQLNNESSSAAPANGSPANDPTKVNLLKAALLLAKIDNPDIDVDSYVRRVDSMASDVRAMFDASASESDRIKKLDHYLFQELGLRGSRFEYDNRSNGYLNEVIDDREGLPITLAVLYMEIARRLDLKVVGVGLPGHFVVRFEPTDSNAPKETIDVFERGRRLSDEDIALIMSEAGFPNEERFRSAKSPREIIERMASNLLRRTEAERLDDDVLRYLETLVMLSPNDVEYRLKRLEMRYRSNRLQMALEDANWLISESPQGLNVEMIRDLRQKIEQSLETTAE